MAEPDSTLDSSICYRGVRRAGTVVEHWLGRAGEARPVRAGRDASRRAYVDSRLQSVAAVSRRWVRASFLYRWLTGQPSDRSIVVDLRTSGIAGPFVGLAVAALGTLRSGWRTARVRALLESVGSSVRGAPIRAASVLALAILLAEASLAVVSGSSSLPGFVVRLLAIGAAILGTRITTPWDALRSAKTYRLVRTVFEVPREHGDERT